MHMRDSQRNGQRPSNQNSSRQVRHNFPNKLVTLNVSKQMLWIVMRIMHSANFVETVFSSLNRKIELAFGTRADIQKFGIMFSFPASPTKKSRD
jgi:hypothetical protein